MYSKHKVVFFVLIAITFTTAGLYPVFFSEMNAQQKSSKADRKKQMMPIPSAPEEEDSQKRLAREKKNRRYNFHRGEDLTEQIDGDIFGRVSETPPPIPIPSSTSDLIVVGEVLKAQPYLAESKTSIYSEFTIYVEDILKNNSTNSISIGNSIIADREGGAIINPNGKVLRYEVGGIGELPMQNRRYLFFLKANSNENDYTILTGYELNSDGVLPLENYKDREVYKDKSESEFVKEVKRSISSN